MIVWPNDNSMSVMFEFERIYKQYKILINAV